MNEPKNLYVNSRLHPLLVGPLSSGVRRDWIFSLGEPWLLVTPDRLAGIAGRVGKGDGRVHRLLGLVRRHCGDPEVYCRRLGVAATRRLEPEDYPLVLCPRCDGAHFPHPEDAGAVCAECREAERIAQRGRPGGGEILDRRLDRAARRLLYDRHPDSFHDGALCPNYRYNLRRRVHRDWDRAANRIFMGHPYRQVAREFDCSVGLLHSRVKERHWERN